MSRYVYIVTDGDGLILSVHRSVTGAKNRWRSIGSVSRWECWTPRRIWARDVLNGRIYIERFGVAS